MGYPNNTQQHAVYTVPFGQPTTARQLAAGSTSASTTLSTGVKGISIRAISADIRFSIGMGTQTASASTSTAAGRTVATATECPAAATTRGCRSARWRP